MNGSSTSAAVQDLEVIGRVAQQDKSAFSSFYDRHSQMVFNLAWRVLGHRQEAEDVVQEVFLQIWKEASAFDPRRGSLSAWLTTITRSRAIDKLRSRKARRIDSGLQDPDKDMTQNLPDHIRQGERWEARILVSKALATLGSDQRLALEMAYYQGMSQTEIAAALKQPLGTVKTRIRSGLNRLREGLSLEKEG